MKIKTMETRSTYGTILSFLLLEHKEGFGCSVVSCEACSEYGYFCSH